MKKARAAVTGSPQPSFRSACAAFFLATVSLAIASPGWASANVSCAIDDNFLSFELEAIAGRDGPIMQVQTGRISVKKAADFELAAPDVSFDKTQIVQQWMFDDDMRLQVVVDDAKAQQTIDLVILARNDAKQDKYFGRYILTLSRAGASKKLQGRIKQCEAG